MWLTARALQLKCLGIALLLSGVTSSLLAQTQSCAATSGVTVTPVIELFTSEGCSSCPPADKWLSALKQKSAAGEAVVQAFHVGYWDYIGWVDRFASPAYTQRQRDIATKNKLRGIYTPQVVLNGRDWPDWHARAPQTSEREVAKASISLKQTGVDRFDAVVTALPAMQGSSWSAYWTVTEHGHNSKVLAGENSGELLKHDFVVRQMVQAGVYKADNTVGLNLSLRTISLTPLHPRQVNLVVYEPESGKTLQALSLSCAS